MSDDQDAIDAAMQRLRQRQEAHTREELHSLSELLGLVWGQYRRLEERVRNLEGNR
jgi:hypothetical protein